jgi:hypothetical protein
MTRRLDEAIETLRDLPEDEQDAAASALFAYISSDDRRTNCVPITPKRFAAFGVI